MGLVKRDRRLCKNTQSENQAPPLSLQRKVFSLPIQHLLIIRLIKRAAPHEKKYLKWLKYKKRSPGGFKWSTSRLRRPGILRSYTKHVSQATFFNHYLVQICKLCCNFRENKPEKSLGEQSRMKMRQTTMLDKCKQRTFPSLSKQTCLHAEGLHELCKI